MKSFKIVAEEFVPKFQRATKTDVHYTGVINGKTYVVPHAFHGNHDILRGTKVTPIRHSIVVSPIHISRNNPTLTPEESARVHSHIKDIHGGQNLANLDEEERQQSLHLGMTRADRVQPSKEVPEVKTAETHYKKTHKPVKGTPEYQDERDKYRHAAIAASRKAATLAFAKKRNLLEIRNMLNEGRPIRGDVFSHHQTLIAKKTLRMPDAMVHIMGGPNKEESRNHLKKMGWTVKQIHDHEHAQFTEEVNVVQEHVWNVTDHLGNTHSVEAKDHSEALKKTVSVGGVHSQGIPMTQWHKVRVERKNLEEGTEQLDEISIGLAQRVHDKRNAQGDALVARAARPQYATQSRAITKKAAEKFKKADISFHHIMKKVFRESEQLGESFMSTFHRNEQANRHTENIVHLARHFGTPADHAEAKFYAAEHKKHGHNIHRDAQDKIYEKLFPRALAAHHNEVEHLDESFMSTYNRNENANRHTANIVHLAKHFGTAADHAEAKFYAAELKKHGHNKHHEAAYKLHEKLWPSAVAAHNHVKEPGEAMTPPRRGENFNEANTLKPLTKYSYVPARNHFVAGRKGDATYRKHRAEYLKKKKITPVNNKWYPKEVKEESEQLDELKMPNTGWLGAHPREIAGRVHDMGHHELKSLHKSYEKNPPQSVVQKQQHRSIKTALRKYGDAQGTHKPLDRSKFIKKDLKEGLMSFVQRKIAGPIEKRHAEYNNEKKKLHKSQFVKNAAGPTRLPKAISEEAHSDTFNTVKTVIHESLRKNLRSQSDIDKFARRGRAAKNLLGLQQSLKWPKPIVGAPNGGKTGTDTLKENYSGHSHSDSLAQGAK